jgi:hypothetical protein
MIINFTKTNILIGVLAGLSGLIALTFTLGSSYINNSVRSTINESYLVKFEKLKQENQRLKDNIEVTTTQLSTLKKIVELNSEKIDSKNYLFHDSKKNNISITFGLNQNSKLFELYFLHKGYIVNALSGKLAEVGKLKNRIKIHFSYDLSKENFSMLFTDLIESGLNNIVCVEPISWVSDKLHVSVRNMRDDEKCENSYFSKKVTKKELDMFRRTKYEHYNPKYSEKIHKKEERSAYFLELHEFRNQLKLGDISKKEKIKEAYEMIRYGK